MEIKEVPISSLNAASYNPRKDLKPGDAEYEHIKKSIQTFGYIDPIIWNKRTGRVVGGHQRLKVLQELGQNNVKVVEVDFDEDKEKAANIALNKISGDWEPELLQNLLDELEDSDFDMGDFGINDDFLKSLHLTGDSEFDDFDDKAVPPTALFQVIVSCDSEEDQKNFYDRMVAEGRTVKLINM